MPKFYNDNTAYDLSKFEAHKPKQPQLAEVPKPKAAPAKTVLGLSPIKAILCMALIIGVTVSFIYSRAMLVEVNEEVNAANEQLQILESEKTRLDMELESMVSLKNIEELAENMGLTKVEKYQVEYIDLSQGDKVVVSDEAKSTSFFDQIWQAVQKIVSYLKFW